MAPNALALSPAEFLAKHENDRDEARAAASKLVPKSVPAPQKSVPRPKRVGRQIKSAASSAVPAPPPSAATPGNIRPARDIGGGSSGFSGLFSSIKKRFGFKKNSQVRRKAAFGGMHLTPMGKSVGDTSAPENYTAFQNVLGPPDMMSASEGGGGHAEADVVREVVFIL